MTITNDKGRLSPEDIERMVADAERFAEEDELVKKTIEARNALENLVYSLKGQLADQDGLGGKLDSGDKKLIEDELRKATEWIDEHGAAAAAEDFDEQREALQAAVAPITAKIYSSAGGGDDSGYSHDEL